jgi:hypothetical protein
MKVSGQFRPTATLHSEKIEYDAGFVPKAGCALQEKQKFLFSTQN